MLCEENKRHGLSDLLRKDGDYIPFCEIEMKTSNEDVRRV